VVVVVVVLVVVVVGVGVFDDIVDGVMVHVVEEEVLKHPRYQQCNNSVTTV
jgi:hypothetical protein